MAVYNVMLRCGLKGLIVNYGIRFLNGIIGEPKQGAKDIWSLSSVKCTIRTNSHNQQPSACRFAPPLSFLSPAYICIHLTLHLPTSLLLSTSTPTLPSTLRAYLSTNWFLLYCLTRSYSNTYETLLGKKFLKLVTSLLAYTTFLYN